jgi:aminoglycoside phosphotransferase family enzyme/predicted kinase
MYDGDTKENDISLITALQNPNLYDFPIERFSVIETHISWVILTGTYAYKIKKPVCYGFLDFSSLKNRRHFCEEELRLNRRFAPQLYIGVIPVTGQTTHPQLGGHGRPIEYVIKMREFSQDGLLSTMAATQHLTPLHIDSIAKLCADFHASAEPAPTDSTFGLAADTHAWVKNNFQQIKPLLKSQKISKQLAALELWSETEYNQQHTYFEQRKREGFVRECHGDLHLGNMALIDKQVTFFDCIEFNAELRWIDVISEAAFVTMDLHDRGYAELGWHYLNTYLQFSGDYAGIRLLRYYLVYRAMVRAKVAAISLDQTKIKNNEATRLQQELEGYLQLAETYCHDKRPALILMHGLSGSGKSTVARHLAENLGLIQIRSDLERKRLYGLNFHARSESTLNKGLYSAAVNEKTYSHLLELATHVIEAGYTALVDASFLEQSERLRFSSLATRLQVAHLFLDCEASTAELRKRIIQRARQGIDPSEANVGVLEHQLTTQYQLSSDELRFTLKIDTTQPIDKDKLGHLISKHLNP